VRILGKTQGKKKLLLQKLKVNQDKLSDLISLWKLSILNCVIIFICFILMLNLTIIHLVLGDFYLLIALICLLIVFFVNFVFVIFPIKFLSAILRISGKFKVFNQKTKDQTTSSESGQKAPPKPILPQIELAPLKVSAKKNGTGKGDINGEEYLSEEDMALGVPAIPVAPKKREKITIDSPGLSTDILNKIKEIESKDIEVVLVNCDRCESVIPVPIPKKAVSESELPVVPISYVHTHDKDQHCITIHVDHDFDIRRQRISDVVLS
jgi:hypothetical protein